jgi:hypothetical protein
MMFARQRFLLVAVVLALPPCIARGQTLSVTSTSPLANSWAVSASSNITITCSSPLMASSADGIHVYSRNSGVVSGAVTVSANTIVFNPAQNLFSGDVISVTLSAEISSTTADVLAVPHMFQFAVQPGPGPVDPPLFIDMPFALPEPRSNSRVFDAADLDSDGDMDVVLSNRWLENDGQQNFITHDFDHDPFAFDMRVVDIDYDTDMDIVGATFDGMYVLENDGHQVFSQSGIAPGEVAYNLSLADANDDGRLDLLYSQQGQNGNVSWLINHSDGTFTKEIVAADGVYNEILACDVNGDHLLDVVARGNNAIVVFENTGGVYTKTVLAEGPYQNPSVADMDGDHDIDLIVNNGSQLIILENDGTGNFTEHEVSHTEYPADMAYDIADINADGKPDIVVGHSYSLEYFMNQGDYSFLNQTLRYFGQETTGAKARDMDNDGDIDILYRVYYGGVGWLKNTNRGEAIPFEVDPVTSILPDNTDQMAWADYDKDGDQDVLVTAYSTTGPVTRLFRQTNSGLELAGEFNVAWLGDCAWFDMEQDGDLDFIVSGATVVDGDAYKSGKAFVYVNTNGTFALQEEISNTLPGLYQGDIAVADFNQDGKDDLLMGGGGDMGGMYTYNDSAFHKVLALDYISTGATLAVSDIDLDGDPDFVASGWTGNNTLSTIFINQGGFNFTENKKAFNGIAFGRLMLRDFDNDADPDLAVLGYHYNVDVGYGYTSYSYYSNNGDGTFVFRPMNFEGQHLFADKGSDAADFDNDGYLDIFGRLSSEKYLYLNDRAGWFKDSHYEFGGPYFSEFDDFVNALDFDDDHDMDFMIGKTMYRNNIETPNQMPVAPSMVADSVRNNILYMYWSGASDAETPGGALTYQPYVGTVPNGTDILSPQSNLQTGRQYIQHEGPARQAWKTYVPSGGNYYWGVQAIDATLGPSLFSSENIAKVIFIDGASKACANVSQVYKATPDGSYTWNVKGGQVVSSSATQVEVIWTAEGYGSVSVTDGTNKNLIDVRIVKKPQPSISGNVDACAQSDDNVYLAPAAYAGQYLWIIEGGTILDNALSNEIHVEWAASGEGRVRLQEKSVENVCVIEEQKIVTIHPIPEPSISGPDLICADDHKALTYLNETAGAGNSMEWSVFGGTIEGSDTGSELNVFWNDQAFGRITLTETNEHCEALTILEISIITLAKPDIAGSFIICNPATEYSYSTVPVAGYTYLWSATGGTIQGDADRHEVTVGWTDVTKAKLSFQQSFNGCVAMDSAYINIHPPYEPEIIVVDETTIETENAFDYQWSLNGSEMTGETSRTLHIEESGNYTVVVTDFNGCQQTSGAYGYRIVGIDELPGDHQFSLHPNPATDFVSVELINDYRGPIELTVYDVFGKVLKSSHETKDEQQFQAKLQYISASAGFVIVDVAGKDFSLRKKIVWIGE